MLKELKAKAHKLFGSPTKPSSEMIEELQDQEEGMEDEGIHQDEEDEVAYKGRMICCLIKESRDQKFKVLRITVFFFHA